MNEEELRSVFGGEFNFVETKLNFRAYQPLVEKEWLIFKYNTTLGRVWSTDGTALPFIHRYRAGGINSVRGYDWFTLGPQIRASGYKQDSRTTFFGSDDPTSAEDRLVVGGTETWINNIELGIGRPAGGHQHRGLLRCGQRFRDPWGEGHVNPVDLRLAYGFGDGGSAPWARSASSGASSTRSRTTTRGLRLQHRQSLLRRWGGCHAGVRGVSLTYRQP